MAIQITAAGTVIDDVFGVLKAYATEHPKTLNCFDFGPREGDHVTPELIASTRTVSSRISDDQAQALIQVVNGLDWTGVPASATLAAADPSLVGQVFDRAAAIYVMVRDAGIPRVKDGKTSKVLHLLRPGLIPILDSRIQSLYRIGAIGAAAAIKEARSDFAYQRTYWGAIRNDLIANRGALDDLRAEAAESDDPLLVRIAGELSDVRLLDMLTWKASSRATRERNKI